MKVVIIVQARTGSTRLPGKVLLPIGGKPLLIRLLERLAATSEADEIVVASSIDPGDNLIEEICSKIGYGCFRGHPTDLIDRHLRAGEAYGADVVVKIPSDCPLIDPSVIDKVIRFYRDHAGEFDYVSNLHPPTYPDGNDVEIIPMPVLTEAWRLADKKYEREHTTPFIWEQPQKYRIGNVLWETGLDYSMSYRFTIDYKEDYDFIRRVYDELWTSEHPIFSLEEILDLLERKKEIYELNAQFAGVNWYRDHIGELKTIGAGQTRQLVST